VSVRAAAIALALALAASLAVAAPTAASERHPTQAELESEIICPTCKTTLDQSNAEVAQQLKRQIRMRIAQGWTKSRIEDELVASFGEGVLAAPPKRGFNLLAWLLPLVGLAAGALAVGALAWRWSRTRDDRGDGEPVDPALNGHRELDPELERRVDEALARFDG
jgi:cytochrome c-type biogenesis protein CcmH